MIKKILIFTLLILYLYTLTFGIFLNSYLRVPSPILFGIPLIALFWQKGRLLYIKEAVIFFIAAFIYYGIGMSDFKSFSVNMMEITACLLFFNFFIGKDYQRFRLAIIVFYCLLAFSTGILFISHLNPSLGIELRTRLLGSEIFQSPSGIAANIFTFGYQLAPLVSFLFVACIVYEKSWLTKAIVMFACLIAIFLGLQRSVLVTFGISSTLFLIGYYKYKSVLFLAILIVFSMLFSTFFIAKSGGDYDNIFAKNERNSDEDRGRLMSENLNIYADYPFGLVFYGKTWSDVIKHNTVFVNGITSHNAYLMFFTYLGPFVGIGLLVLMYRKIISCFIVSLNNIYNIDSRLLVCLCFSFMGVSLNALFHNAWLLNANGPTIFIYFAVIHLYNLQSEEKTINAH